MLYITLLTLHALFYIIVTIPLGGGCQCHPCLTGEEMEVQVREVGGLQLSWDSNSGAASKPMSSSLHSGPPGCMKCLRDLFMTLLPGAVDRIAQGSWFGVLPLEVCLIGTTWKWVGRV